MYWNDPVSHDRPLITNCFVPGLAQACGLKPSSATEEGDLDMLLANIALADQEARPLSYSRNNNHAYRDITTRRVVAGIAKLASAGLALERRTRPGHRGWQSDVRATPTLTEVFDRHGQRPIYAARDPIIIRSRKDGHLLPTPPMKDRIRQVERTNEMLSGVSLDLVGALRLRNHLWLFERLEQDQFGNFRILQQKVRLDRMRGRRVFTSDLLHHGRFYCAAQNIPATARLQCILNGEQVVELDFTSMHVSLAYALRGVGMAGESYEIAGFTRKQAKVGILTAFNATSPQNAIAALTDARQGRPTCQTRQEAQCLLEALRTKHWPIESMLCTDAGMKLMHLDARIMLAAVDHLIAKGIHCIPVHDSILVQAQYEGEAREALAFGWHTQNLLLTHCGIEKKSQNVLQYGGGAGWGGSSCSDLGAGWWSSVLTEARFDVVEWVAR